MSALADGRRRVTPPGVPLRVARRKFEIKASEMVTQLRNLGFDMAKSEYKAFERGEMVDNYDALAEAVDTAFVNVARARRGESPLPLPSSKQHIVYRVYDVDGRLLYVGCTSNLPQRMANHRATAKWAYRMSTVVESPVYHDRDSAYEAERHAIATEHPAFNVKSRSLDRRTWTRQDYLDYMAAREHVAYVPRVAKQLARLHQEMVQRFGEVA